MFLGGTYFQIPPLKYAKEQGHHVITCDYLPDNPGHKYADEYHNVSTTDMHAVLKLAEQLKIDGIVAYASDPSAPTAAFVAEKMGLPGNPFKSVLTLARKDLYRKFLADNGFHTPRSKGFFAIHDAIADLDSYIFPIVVKPVDSCGSKGVTVIQSADDLAAAYGLALEYSRADGVLLEEYVEKDGYQVAGDGFIVDGKLAFRCFANEHFDYSCNGLVPIGESFPYVGGLDVQQKIHDEVQRVLDLLNMQIGALNFDVRIDPKGNVQLMEIGPRNGGNLIPEVTKCITGVDMIKYTVDIALGMDCSALKMTPPNGYYASYIMHALKDGVVDRFEYSDEIKDCIVEEVRWCKEGDSVMAFKGSNCTLGTQILKFESQDQMLRLMDNMNDSQRIVLR